MNDNADKTLSIHPPKIIRPLYRLIHHFIGFLRHPADMIGNAPLSPAAALTLFLVIHLVFITVFTMPLIYLVDEHVIKLRMPLDHFMTTLAMLILLTVIAAPFLEELLFRYPLKFAGSISLPYFRNRRANFKAAIYVSSVVFGAAHLANYSNTETIFYILSPIIVSSQLFSGFIFAYLRLQYGLWWSICCHALFNGIVGLAIPFCFQHGDAVLEISNPSQRLVVKEYLYTDGKSQMIDIHRSAAGIDSITARQVDLQRLLDSIKPGLYVDNVIVDLDFNTQQPITNDSLLCLLSKEYRILDAK